MIKLVKSELMPSGLYYVEFDVGLHGLVAAGPEELENVPLLFQRLLEGTTWIKSPRYDPKATAGMSLEARLLMLEGHHVAEVAFLLNAIRCLGAKLV